MCSALEYEIIEAECQLEIICRSIQWLEYSQKVLETGVQSQVKSYQRFKMVLDVSLLNTQHYM